MSRRSVKLLNGWNAGHSSMCNKHPPHHPQPAPPAHPIPSVPSHPPARSGQAADHCHRHAGGGAQVHPRLRQVRPHRGRGGAPRDCWQGHDQPASMLFGAWTATGSGVRCPASRNLTQVVLRRARLCAFYPPPLGPAGGQHVSWPAPGPARDRGTHGSSTGGHAATPLQEQHGQGLVAKACDEQAQRVMHHAPLVGSKDAMTCVHAAATAAGAGPGLLQGDPGLQRGQRALLREVRPCAQGGADGQVSAAGAATLVWPACLGRTCQICCPCAPQPLLLECCCRVLQQMAPRCVPSPLQVPVNMGGPLYTRLQLGIWSAQQPRHTCGPVTHQRTLLPQAHLEPLNSAFACSVPLCPSLCPLLTRPD